MQGDKIGYNEFFDEQFDKQIKLLVEALQAIGSEIKKISSIKPPRILAEDSGKEAVELQTSMQKLINDKLRINELRKLEGTLSKQVHDAEIAQMQKVWNEHQKNIAAQEKEEKQRQKEIGDINQLIAANKRMEAERRSIEKIDLDSIKRYNDLTIAMRKNQTIINEHNESAKRYQGNVGNYLGALKNWGESVITQFSAITAGFMGIQAVLGILKEKLTVIFQFEKSMSNLRALTGLDKEAVKPLGDAAIEMSKKWGTAAKDIVEGMKLIIGNKPELKDTREDLLKVTDAALLFSKASGLDLPTSAMRLTETLNQLKIPSRDVMKLVEQMAVAAKEGSAEIPDLTLSLKEFAAIANSSNISSAETMALIETLGSRGIKGTEAGTPLRNIALMMDGVSVASKKALAELKEWGVNTDIVSNRSLSFTDRLRELSKISNDAGAMMKFFGKENAVAGTVLFEETKFTDDLTEKIKKNIEAQKMANDNTDNTIDKWNKVKTNVDAAILSFVNNSSAVKTLTDDLKSLTDKIGDPSKSGSTSFAMSILDSTLQGMYNNFFGYGVKAINALGDAIDWLGNKASSAISDIGSLFGIKPTEKKKDFTGSVNLPSYLSGTATQEISQGGHKDTMTGQILGAVKKESAQDIANRLGITGQPDEKTQKAYEKQLKSNDEFIAEYAASREKLNEQLDKQDEKYLDSVFDKIYKEIEIEQEKNDYIKTSTEELDTWKRNKTQQELDWEKQTWLQKTQFISSYLGQSKDLFKEHTIAYKLLASGQAAIDTAGAALQSYKAMAAIPVIGPALGWAAAAIATAFGLKQIATINGVQFAEGIIDFKGHGTETSDENPVLISNRESIITARGTKNAPNLLKGINEGYIKDSDYIISNTNSTNQIFESKRLEERLEEQIEETKKMSKKINNLGFSYFKNGRIYVVKGDGTTEIMINK